ncbi:MAG: CvpA family protein [bacterium]|nr:CvpA family protein [bacterium]
MTLNWVDIILGLIIVSFAGLGIYRGILREALSLAGLAIGVFAGFKLYEVVGWHLEGFLKAGPGVANLIAFLGIFAVILGIFAYLGHLLKKAAEKVFVAWLDRTLGGIFGAVKGTLISSVVALVLALFPFTSALEDALNSSVIGPHVVKIAPAIYGTVMSKLRSDDYDGLKIEELITDYAENGPGSEKPDIEEDPDEKTDRWEEIKGDLK